MCREPDPPAEMFWLKYVYKLDGFYLFFLSFDFMGFAKLYIAVEYMHYSHLIFHPSQPVKSFLYYMYMLFHILHMRGRALVTLLACCYVDTLH